MKYILSIIILIFTINVNIFADLANKEIRGFINNFNKNIAKIEKAISEDQKDAPIKLVALIERNIDTTYSNIIKSLTATRLNDTDKEYYKDLVLGYYIFNLKQNFQSLDFSNAGIGQVFEEQSDQEPKIIYNYAITDVKSGEDPISVSYSIIENNNKPKIMNVKRNDTYLINDDINSFINYLKIRGYTTEAKNLESLFTKE